MNFHRFFLLTYLNGNRVMYVVNQLIMEIS